MFPNDDLFDAEVSLESQRTGVVDEPVFRILLIGDYAGHGTRKPLSERPVYEVDRDEIAAVMRKMANLTAIETVTEKDPAAAAFIVKTTQYFVPMAGKIDAEAERRKLTDELSYQEGFLASVMKKLSNERFMQSAPEKVVANERAKQADAEAKIAAIKAQLEALS